MERNPYDKKDRALEVTLEHLRKQKPTTPRKERLPSGARQPVVLQTFRYACKPKPSSNNRSRPQLGAIAALNRDTLSAIQTLMGTAQSREASNLLVNTALKTQSASQLHSQRPGKITDQLSCSGWVFWWDCKLEAGGKSQAPPTHENHGQVMHVENAKYNSHGVPWL